MHTRAGLLAKAGQLPYFVIIASMKLTRCREKCPGYLALNQSLPVMHTTLVQGRTVNCCSPEDRPRVPKALRFQRSGKDSEEKEQVGSSTSIRTAAIERGGSHNCLNSCLTQRVHTPPVGQRVLLIWTAGTQVIRGGWRALHLSSMLVANSLKVTAAMYTPISVLSPRCGESCKLRSGPTSSDRLASVCREYSRNRE